MDPLQLDPTWPSAVSLIDLETALEQSLLQSGLSRQDYIKRLAQDLHKPRLQPLLWLLPRRWRLAPAQLPQQLHGLAQLLERGLLTPACWRCWAMKWPSCCRNPIKPPHHWAYGAAMAKPTSSPGMRW